MKQIELIKIDSGEAVVYEHQDFLQISTCDLLDNNRMIENSDMEFLASSYIEVENIPIQRLVENNIDHYVAVTRKVWEWLYLLENPVTAKAQEKKIESLSDDLCKLSVSFDNTSLTLSKLSKKVYNANLWQRIKWIFTGVKP